MEEISSFLQKIQAIIEENSKYKLEAYSFVMGALNYTVSHLDKPRHVSGREFLEGIREYAIDQYGPLARLVFEHWGIKATQDFGEIVFALVDAGLMSKTDKDCLEDFKGVYDFKKVFDKAYHFDIEELNTEDPATEYPESPS